MSKKDKRLLIIVCIVTSVLLSVLVTDIIIRIRYGNKITYIYESIKRINETVEELQNDKTTGS